MTIRARPSPLQVLSFLDFFVAGDGDGATPDENFGTEEDFDTLTLMAVTASAFAEDMSSDN